MRKSSLRRVVTGLIVIGLWVLPVVAELGRAAVPDIAYANGFVDFEDGIDKQAIRSTIPGLRFTTTQGYDWIYGDWRTNSYNGKYPNGLYTSNGNFFAWLGPNQGYGRIDFLEGGATYLSVGISTANSVTLTGYDGNGQQIAQTTFSGGNLNTGRSDEMRITAPSGQRFQYALVSGQANYWLIDDLSTDAAGVPNSRTPLVFIPGIGGSKFSNVDGEVWPNMPATAFNSSGLRVLRLGPDGTTPLETSEPYTSVARGDIIRTAARQDVYQSMIDYLEERGYKESDGTLIVFPYDWRKSITETVILLDQEIARVKSAKQVDQVNILAHSMGGLVARAYIAESGRAGNVDTLVTLGTPYLGAPKLFQALQYGACLIDKPWCIPSPSIMNEIVQNFPGVYQLLPGRTFFDVYPRGYFNLDRDTNNDGQNEGWQDYADVNQRLSASNNAALVTNAVGFRGLLDSGFANGTNGVRVYAFVGDGQGTTGYIREYMKPRWLGRGSEVAYDITPMNGDNAVPLYSGDLGRGQGSGMDYSGSVSFFYANLDHGQLASYNGGRTVLRLVGDILEVRGAPAAVASAYSGELPAGLPVVERVDGAGLLRAEASQQNVSASDWLPITTAPTPLTGRQLLLQGAVSVMISDPIGGELHVAYGQVLTTTISGASVTTLGSTTSIFLQDGGPYTIVLTGEATDSVDLRWRQIAADVVTQTVLFKDLAFTPTMTGTLTYVSAAPNDQITMYQAGALAGVIQPTSLLDANSSSDVTYPLSSINLQGSRGPQGWYVGPVVVTIAASDNPGGSGLAKIEYSLDNGQTVQTYSGPFTIPNAATVSFVLAKATDRAGNEEAPLTAVGVGPVKIMVPLILR